MRDIKTKTTAKDIKALDKAADVSFRMKNAYIRTKEQAEQMQQPEHDGYIQYAEDKVNDGIEAIGGKVGHSMERQGKKTVQKIKERHNAAENTDYTGSASGNTSSGQHHDSQTNRNTGFSRTKPNAASQTVRTSDTYSSSVSRNFPAPRKAVQSEAAKMKKRKYTFAKPNELAKQQFIQSRAKECFTQHRESQSPELKSIMAEEPQAEQNFIHPDFIPTEKTVRRDSVPNLNGAQRMVKQSTQSINKAAKESAKGTVKTVQKTVKTAEQSAKTGVKTYQTVAKTAQTATQAAKRTAQAAQSIQRTAQAAKTAARFTIRMIKLTVKATSALVKSLIAFVGTGGAVLSLFLVIIAIAALVASPFGIFFSNENKDAEVKPISNVVQEVNAELTAKIEAIKDENNTVDSVEIHYPGSADNVRVDNWMDVIAVFAVKTAMDQENGMDVATIDTTRIDLIKSVFWDMNLIDYYIETIEHTETETVDNGDGTTSEETTTTYEHILHITVTSKTAEQQATEYGFTDDQKSIMEEMLSGEFRPMMFTLLGMDGDTGLTAEQLQNLYNDLPEGELGGQAVKLALSRLGDPYSQPKAGQGNYTDCSYLVQWCYQQLGVSLPRTAAAQAEYCVNNRLTISPNDLKPGDLVFWSFENNDRFMNISHVGIYAGDGKVIDASSTRGQVVYRDLYDKNNQVLYARPGV